MSKKKYKKPPPPEFVPANPEQEAAVSSAIDFIDNGDPAHFFTLEGKAGTGKTTLMHGVLSPYHRKRHIIVAALSHKAKLVLETKLHSYAGLGSVQAETLASLIGMVMDPETGRFIVNENIMLMPPIVEASILVLDECSMINEQGLHYIMTKKPPHCKVIFIGDVGQLPPIREEWSSNADAPSPTFNTPYKAKLITRIRQGEESPILPYADLYWNNSQLDYPVRNPAIDQDRESIVMDKGSLVFSNSGEALSKLLPFYQKAVETGNQDIIRTICYKNSTRQILNAIIRERLFPTAVENEYEPGDLLMFYDNYEIDGEPISNSTEIQVKTASREVAEGGWMIYDLGVAISGKPRQLQVLRSEEHSRRQTFLQNLANHAKSLPKGPERSDAWRNYYLEKNRFAPLEYGYAITCHKCQGSTYDIALVAEADIMNVVPTSNKSKSQAIYTAITRAKHLAVIMDGRTVHEGELEKAIALIPETVNLNYD